MEKYFIIILIIFIIINLILLIPVQVRIIKRFDRPLLFRVHIFNHIFYQKIITQNNNAKEKKFKFKLKYIFETDLNVILDDLKKTNFFIYLALEHSSINKVTVIPAYNSSNPILMPYIGVADWIIVSAVKKYINSTFKNVSDEYYQIILLKDDTQGINFEIYATITLFKFIIAIFKNFKVFLKTIRKKETSYE